MKSAKIVDSKVVDIAVGLTGGYIECPPDCAIGYIYDGENFAPPVIIVTLSESKIRAALELEREYINEFKKLAPYSDEERATFEKQEQEARAYQENNAASTPFLDAYSTESGMPKSKIVDNIMAKVTAYEISQGALLGKKKAREQSISNAESVEDLTALPPVEW